MLLGPASLAPAPQLLKLFSSFRIRDLSIQSSPFSRTNADKSSRPDDMFLWISRSDVHCSLVCLDQNIFPYHLMQSTLKTIAENSYAKRAHLIHSQVLLKPSVSEMYGLNPSSLLALEAEKTARVLRTS